MKTLLVLGPHPEFAEAVRAALNPEHYRVIERISAEEAEPLLSPSLIDFCLADMETANVQAIWTIEKLRRRLPKTPLIIYTGSKQCEWEEVAYLKGASHILAKPVRSRLLTALLERSTLAQTLNLPSGTAQRPFRPVKSSETFQNSRTSHEALQVLRDFSAILTHSLQADLLLKQFLLLLREIVGVNRAAVFLRQPVSGFTAIPSPLDSRRLHSACAIGLSPGLLEHFELSFEAGIGGYLFRQGRILRRETEEAQSDTEIIKEFELLGAQVAIPILDRETLVGVAVFDGRVTGEPLVNGELELIFHLLEELGLAIKNIWLHDQLAANHEMLAGILRELSSACIVVGRDLTVLHANRMARNYFGRTGQHAGLEFNELPQVLGSKIYQVLKSGTGLVAFPYSPPDKPQTVYQVTIVPFQRENSILPNAVLLVAEDHTQAEQLKRLEIEAANLRLVKTMADRLTHEIGNALVPLSTHQQLLEHQFNDPEFRESLNVALADGVKRVSRLTSQLRFLARDTVVSKEAFTIDQLIEEAFQEARKHQPVKSSQLKFDHHNQPIILTGDRAALKHALAEIMINALQSNESDARVTVRVQVETNSAGEQWVHVEIQDNGGGFSVDALKKVPAPFFTTRNVGLGLGLIVTQKILQTHQGKLEVSNSPADSTAITRISLPLSVAA